MIDEEEVRVVEQGRDVIAALRFFRGGWLPLLLTIVVITPSHSSTAQDSQQKSSAPHYEKQTEPTTSDSLVSVQDDSTFSDLETAIPDSSAADGMISDSLATDTLSVESLGSSVASTQPAKPKRPPWVIVPPDTTAPRAASPVAVSIDLADFSRHAYKDAGEMAGILPSLYPRQSQLFSQPFYLFPPGHSARSLTVMYRGRPYDSPVTDATNFATYAAEEVQQMHLSESWDGSGPGASGPILTISPPHAYPTTALTRVVYRQGFYGLGHADWRISQQVNEEFAYHIGVNIGEYRGRFTNTFANTSMVRVGGRQQIRDIGHLQLYWMETRETHGRVLLSGTANTRRNDLDLILSGGTTADRDYRELAFWYVRTQMGYRYGDEDGNRTGGRFETWHKLADSKRTVSLRADVERTAARFVRRPLNQDPSAVRTVGGLTLRHQVEKDRLHSLLALRSEFGTRSALPDTISLDPVALLGGAAHVDYGDSLGFGLVGEVSRSWRWPALDEAFGFWSLRTPDRWMDLTPPAEIATLYSFGNPALRVETSIYSGGGVRFRQSADRSLRLMAGVRRTDDPIRLVPVGTDQVTRGNGPSRTNLELSGFGWLDLFFGLSTAGSWSWSDAAATGEPYPATWGWGSLRYDQFFYHSQLRVRLSITGHYYGDYQYQNVEQPSAWVTNGLATVKISNFEVYYGVQNIFDQSYTLFPGLPFEHRSDVWGVRWVMWN